MKRSAKVTLLVALSIAATLQPRATHAGPRANDVPPTRTDVAANDEEYRDDALDLPNGSDLEPLVEQAFGARYTNIWIDRVVSPSGWRVGVVGATADDAARLSQITAGNARITLASTRYARANLATYKASIAGILARRAGTYSLYADPAISSVIVKVPNPDAGLVAEIAAAGVPLDAYTLTAGGGVTNTHTSRLEYPPYEGGLSATIYPPGYPSYARACTTAFTVKTSTPTYMGLTAGHCQRYTSEDVYMGDPLKKVSAVGRNSYYASNPVNSDAFRFTIPSSAKSNRVFVDGSSTVHRTLKSPRFTVPDLKLGVRLCFQGITSGNNNCGVIVAENAAMTDTAGVIHYAWEIDYPAQPGDSGGPVYSVNSDGTARAAGVEFGSVTDTGHMVFHAIGYVLQDLSVELYYG